MTNTRRQKNLAPREFSTTKVTRKREFIATCNTYTVNAKKIRQRKRKTMFSTLDGATRTNTDCICLEDLCNGQMSNHGKIIFAYIAATFVVNGF